MFSVDGRSRTGSFAWSYRNELLALIFAVAALFCGALLYSYNPRDPSWFFHATQMAPATNWCGPFGAYVAALLVYLFGDAAKLIVLILLFGAYACLRGTSWRYDGWRLAVVVALVPLSAALLQFHQVAPRLGFVVGGYAAGVILAFSQRLFDQIGTGLFLYAQLAIVLVVSTRLSFLDVVCACGRVVRRVVGFILERRLVQRASFGFVRMMNFLVVRPVWATARFGWHLLDGTAFEAVFEEMESSFEQYGPPVENYGAAASDERDVIAPVQVGEPRISHEMPTAGDPSELVDSVPSWNVLSEEPMPDNFDQTMMDQAYSTGGSADAPAPYSLPRLEAFAQPEDEDVAQINQ